MMYSWLIQKEHWNNQGWSCEDINVLYFKKIERSLSALEVNIITDTIFDIKKYKIYNFGKFIIQENSKYVVATVERKIDIVKASRLRICWFLCYIRYGVLIIIFDYKTINDIKCRYDVGLSIINVAVNIVFIIQWFTLRHN